MSKQLWAGLAGTAAVVAAGVAFYYMAQEEDEKEIVYDPKVHTKEKFIEIMSQFELEYASLYIHWYSMFKAKEKEIGKGNIPLEVIESAKVQILKLTEGVDDEVLKDHNITKAFFETWSQMYEKDADIK